MNVTLPERRAGDTGPLSPSTPGEQQFRSSTLSSKVTSILSASYADIEIRDALETLDARSVQNNASTRRNLRRDVQAELIAANGEIVHDFGQVATQLRSVGEALYDLQTTVASIRQHVTAARTETKPLLDEASTLSTQRSHVATKQRLLSAFTSHYTLSASELAVLTTSTEPISAPFFAALVHAKRIHHDCSALLSGPSQRLGLEILDSTTKTLHAAFQRLYRFLSREFKSLDLENPRITPSIRRALRVLAERPTLFQNCLDAFAEARERTLTEAFYAALTGEDRAGRGEVQTWQKPIDFSAHEPLRYVGDMLAWAHGTAVSEREALEGLFVAEGEEIARGIREGLESEPWSRVERSGSVGSVDGGRGGPDKNENVAPTGVQPGHARNVSAQPDVFDGRRALAQLINSSLAGVAHLLSSRIDTVIASHDDPVLAYKIANLLVFYRNIFSRLVNQSGFLETLSKIESAALERFQTTMAYTTNNLSDEIDTDAAAAAAQPSAASGEDATTPPEWLHPALENLNSLLKSFETSLSSGAGVVDTSSTAMHPNSNADADTTATSPPALQLIYTTALDPYLALLARIASNPSLTSSAANTTSAIFQLNSLDLVLPVLAAYPTLTAPKRTSISTQIDHLTQTLVEDTHSFLLNTSGLTPLVSALHSSSTTTSTDSKSDPAANPTFTPQTLAAVSAQLDAFLPSAIMDAEARLGHLESRSRVGEVVRRAAELFVGDFEEVEEIVGGIEEEMRRRKGTDDAEDAGEGEEGLRTVFPRTAEEVRVLLS